MTVRQTTLENGLRVVSHTMDAVETVSVGVFIDAGTRNEPVEMHVLFSLYRRMSHKLRIQTSEQPDCIIRTECTNDR